MAISRSNGLIFKKLDEIFIKTLLVIGPVAVEAFADAAERIGTL